MNLLQLQLQLPCRCGAAIANESKRLFGVQFHPEVDLTPCGKHIFRNFLLKICGCSANYTMADREKMCVEYIRSSVTPGAKVLLLLSGGVDSTVCAALVNKALDPEHVVALHIDTGFMRENESRDVIASLGRIGIKVLCALPLPLFVSVLVARQI